MVLGYVSHITHRNYDARSHVGSGIKFPIEITRALQWLRATTVVKSIMYDQYTYKWLGNTSAIMSNVFPSQFVDTQISVRLCSETLLYSARNALMHNVWDNFY